MSENLYYLSSVTSVTTSAVQRLGLAGVADALDVSRATVSRWASGKRKPDRETLAHLSRLAEPDGSAEAALAELQALAHQWPRLSSPSRLLMLESIAAHLAPN